MKATCAVCLVMSLVWAATADATTRTWEIEPSPAQTGETTLAGVAQEPGTAGAGGWIFGFEQTGTIADPVYAPVIERRISGEWTAIADPVPGDWTQLYDGVSMSASDAWAVGFYEPHDGHALALTEHWNGTSWKVVKTPKLASGGGYLYGVSMLSTGGGWAVGMQDGQHLGGGVRSPLIESWQAGAWTIDTTLGTSVPANTELESVCQVPGSDEAWAVGDSNLAAPFAALYDGTGWKQVPTPTLPNGGALSSVACVASNNVWAVGVAYHQPLIEHWDGNEWSVVTLGKTFKHGAGLSSITVVPGTRKLWAVGYAFGSHLGGMLIERWTGTSWRRATLPTGACPSGGRLTGISAARGTILEAVGSGCGEPAGLIARYQ